MYVYFHIYTYIHILYTPNILTRGMNPQREQWSSTRTLFSVPAQEWTSGRPKYALGKYTLSLIV